jgi:hypothetical protein
MSEMRGDRFPQFDRDLLGSIEDFSIIGTGEIGGKAKGLAFIRRTLAGRFPDARFESFEISIPKLAVVATGLFDEFLRENDLVALAESDAPDDRIAHAFQRANLPAQIVGDLKALIDKVRQPLAIRSSSLLEDAIERPFAGVYATKMIPNNEHDPDSRFRRLVEAIKLVYASTFFRSAKAYIRSTETQGAQEKMAVIVQEVVGRRHEDRFYPHISGVARSYNYYPVGYASPKEGVVHLALGLGKTIVDGGLCWSFSPAHPRSAPPFGSPRECLKQTQSEFWAVNMGKPPAYDPIRETECLVRGRLDEAERDGTLRYLASTYDAASDRITIGTGNAGPRVLNFATLLALEVFPLNRLVRELMAACEESVGAPVEIEFAVTLPEREDEPARFGFLQVRPLAVSDEAHEVAESEFDAPNLLAASHTALGNGMVAGIEDVVYCIPERFRAADTRAIASEIDAMNRRLEEEGRHCVLIGFGRWGSSDPWLGIPVTWREISQVRVLVEASLPEMNVDPSQGSHFFHNLTSFHVLYFSMHQSERDQIDWTWLERQPTLFQSEHVRHVRLARPLLVRVDGRSGRGVIARTG